jgi:hypothetical protein
MRPQFAIFVVTTAGIILAGIIFLKLQMDHARQPIAPPASARPEILSGSQTTAAPETLPPVVTTTSAAAVPAAAILPPATNAAVASLSETANDQPPMSQEAVNLEVMRLMELSRSSDPQSMTDLFAAAVSPNATIRGAALEGIKGKGDTNAIGPLKNLAAKIQDSIQRKELMDAADFLALPSLSNPAR